MGEDNVRLTLLEKRQGKIEDAILSIDQSLQKIVLLEEKHSQTRELLSDVVLSMKSIDSRVTTIEIDMPQLKEARRWLVAGVACVVVIVISGLVGLLLHGDKVI